MRKKEENRKRTRTNRPVREADRPSKEPDQKVKRGKEYVIVSYLFVFIFVALIGYIVYFNVALKDDIINSPYNKRQDSFAERVVRGQILSSDGETLARTDVDDEGNETRVYPYNNLFAHAVGYVANGKGGLESDANFTLLTSNDFFPVRIYHDLKDEKNIGDNIVTTLDTRLQQEAYDALGDYNGAVVVMEPQTGRILAMVSKPDFDPNTLASDWDSIVNDSSSSVLLNRATQGQYPPGSTFKIVTALTYLRQRGTLDGFDFTCEGSITVDDHTIHCYDNIVHGQETLDTAFANSCNCAFARIGLDLGGSAIEDASESLLFNKKLPLSMEYRKSSFELSDRSGSALTMQTAIGQGNTLTSPMHMALITSAVANGGTLMNPYLIDHVENRNGSVIHTTKPSSYKKLMTATEAQSISTLMQEVVSQGTATSLSGRDYTVAGKTGSAEYYNTDGSIGTHSWFVGFSNVDHPDIVVAIIAEGAGTGSSVAVPAASALFDTYYTNKE